MRYLPEYLPKLIKDLPKSMNSKQNKGIFNKNQEVLFFGNIIYVKFVIIPAAIIPISPAHFGYIRGLNLINLFKNLQIFMVCRFYINYNTYLVLQDLRGIMLKNAMRQCLDLIKYFWNILNSHCAICQDFII